MAFPVLRFIHFPWGAMGLVIGEVWAKATDFVCLLVFHYQWRCTHNSPFLDPLSPGNMTHAGDGRLNQITKYLSTHPNASPFLSVSTRPVPTSVQFAIPSHV